MRGEGDKLNLNLLFPYPYSPQHRVAMVRADSNFYEEGMDFTKPGCFVSGFRGGND